MSFLVDPYIEPVLARVGISRKEFEDYVDAKKDTIEGIESLRKLMVAV